MTNASTREIPCPPADLDDRLVGLIQELVGTDAPLPRPFPLDRQLSELGISSLKMVRLMLSLEAAFDIMIPQADITPGNFHSVATVRALIERTLRARPPA